MNYGTSFPETDNKAGVEKERGLLSTKLFGGYRGDEDGGAKARSLFTMRPENLQALNSAMA